MCTSSAQLCVSFELEQISNTLALGTEKGLKLRAQTLPDYFWGWWAKPNVACYARYLKNSKGYEQVKAKPNMLKQWKDILYCEIAVSLNQRNVPVSSNP